jgi:uncharacterized protein (DUF302 family)
MMNVSRYPFAQTVAVLSKTIADAGNRIFATIDQALAAADAGLVLRPTTLIVFGNPKGGTLLMEAFPAIALELPLKLLVWERDGVVSIAYTPMAEIAARYNVTGADERIAAMDRALEAIVASVT